MKISTIVLFAAVAFLALPSLHAKPMDSMSLNQRTLSEVLQRMIEEQEEALAQEEEQSAETEEPGEDAANTMGSELEVAGIQRANTGVTFIRWGHHDCPKVRNTQKLYYGIVAGTYYNHKGGSANYLCLPDERRYGPRYDAIKTTGSKWYSRLYGTEYEGPLVGVHNHGAPCAVCYDSDDNTQLMIPATTRCPRGWSRDYYGYLMGPGNWNDRSPKDYICVDKEQQSSRGSYDNKDGALLYHVRATCRYGIHCPPYNQKLALTCVVCSK